MNIKNLLYNFLYMGVLLSTCACSDYNPIIYVDEDEGNGGPAHTYYSVFEDVLFSRGFNLTDIKEGVTDVLGILDYDGDVTDIPYWKVGQWNCENNNFINATYTLEGSSFHRYIGAQGSEFSVDTDTGLLRLALKTSTEYGQSSLCPNNPRKAGDPWPHLLVQASLDDSKIVKISDKAEIRMKIDYVVTKDEPQTGITYDSGLHTSQFQWFITVQNRTKGSDEYGKYLWFGLNFYDHRYEYAPKTSQLDLGTNSYIYMPAMEDIMKWAGPREVGKKIEIDIDIMQYIREGFRQAQASGYLTKTDFEDLYIGSMNIGWEVPGTYDVSVDINQFSLTYRE